MYKLLYIARDLPEIQPTYVGEEGGERGERHDTQTKIVEGHPKKA